MNLLAPIAIATLLVLGACSSSHELAVAKGPVFALNADRWQPTPQDLALVKSTAGEVPAAAPVPPTAPVVLAPMAEATRS